MMTAAKSLQVLGQRFFGRAYLAPLARRLGTDPHTLRRWLHCGRCPADLAERRDELLRDLMKERLRDVVLAATMLAKLQEQTSIWDRARANRLLDFFLEMYPPAPLYDDMISTQPDMSAPVRSIDELCAAAPPLVAAQLRDILQGVD